MAKKTGPTVTRRLYSLYPEQIEKLHALAKKSGISQSEYLRELIDVAFVEKFADEMKRERKKRGEADKN